MEASALMASLIPYFSSIRYADIGRMLGLGGLDEKISFPTNRRSFILLALDLSSVDESRACFFFRHYGKIEVGSHLL